MTDKNPSNLDVPLDKIQLPPAELTDELDNAPRSSTDETSQEKEVEIAELDFLSEPDTRVSRVPLEHAFTWEGKKVDAIYVRRLTVAQVGQLASKLQSGAFDRYDIYAAQTGFPAAVLRGLMDDDGDAVTERCQDFFPRAFRADSE
ncbi:hypothetical protein FIU93_28110 [Labrenzia sp. THAF35]|uniref:hypothetical protein n=1 Tax=Labrenzia sp. THAF35 TaxID=2587854 RepID=UPI001269465F|nr:hypothetical protein [Labrenzia sp. THAF35]QFT70681.1 hypothetical protein FIU93_28110 [Labrenzia sp. THAF35]